MEKQDRELSEIIAVYADGTRKVMKKGFICTEDFVDSKERGYMFMFANTSGPELVCFLEAVIFFAHKLGLFQEGDEPNQ